MCLNIDENNPQVTDKDYIVYKVLDTGFISPYRSLKYRMNKWYKAELGVTAKTFGFSIHEGLHYCCTIEDAKNFFSNEGFYDKRIIVECIIPQGTKYYENGKGLGVCEKLKPIRAVKFIRRDYFQRHLIISPYKKQ